MLQCRVTGAPPGPHKCHGSAESLRLAFNQVWPGERWRKLTGTEAQARPPGPALAGRQTKAASGCGGRAGGRPQTLKARSPSEPEPRSESKLRLTRNANLKSFVSVTRDELLTTVCRGGLGGAASDSRRLRRLFQVVHSDSSYSGGPGPVVPCQWPRARAAAGPRPAPAAAA